MPNTIYEDVLEWARTFDVTGDIDAPDKIVLRELKARCNCPYEAAGTLERVIEVQSCVPGGRTGGTFSFLMRKASNGDPFTHPQIRSEETAWNSSAATMQPIVDALAVQVWQDYLPGDIVVAGGPAGSGGAAFTLTYNGRSVEGRQLTFGVDEEFLTGPSPTMVTSQITDGVSARFWFAALKQMGILSGLPDPFISDAPNGQYGIARRDELENWPSNATIKALVREATVREYENWEKEILVPLNIPF